MGNRFLAADGRRWTQIARFSVLSVVLCVATVQAQVKGPGGGTTLSCNVTAPNVSLLRFEGTSELIGDIVITCVGGGAIAAVPSVDVTVALSNQITSRVFDAQGSSEALLLIDEPGTATAATAPVAGYGSNAGLTVCPNPGPSAVASCPGFAYQVSGGDGMLYTVVTSGGPGSPNIANVYQGIVKGNRVTFYGVPVAAPGSNGARVFRITNVRVNANSYSGGSVPVQASISVSNAAALPVANATVIAGFVQASLSASAAPASTLQQCYGQTLTQVSTLSFKELFATAFKTRTDSTVAGQVNTPGPGKGQGSALVQNVPGVVYNSESGFTIAANGSAAGLADFGTRFKAVFANVPAGARLYVSMINVNATQSSGGFFPSASQSAAQLVRGEGAAEGSLISTPSTTTGQGPDGNPIPVVEITTADGSAPAAVWEVLGASPNAIDEYDFTVYVTYAAAGQAGASSGATTVSMSYARGGPTTVPHFNDSTQPKNAFSVGGCRTVLLFTFLTSQSGFDTNIVISNTSTDPFGTAPQSGTCALNWYASGGQNPAATTTPVLGAPGSSGSSSTYTASLSSIAPNFAGYMIAVCGFQYAHGMAFVSDLGGHNQIAAYHALVIPDPAVTGGRMAGTAGEQLTQ